MKEISINDPVYKTCLRVWVCPKEDLNKFLSEWGLEDVEETQDSTAGRLIRIANGDSKTDPNANMTLIWLKKWDISTLIHELSHHVIRTFHEKDIPINWDNTEAFAYYLEYWYKAVIDGKKRLSQQDTSGLKAKKRVRKNATNHHRKDKDD